MSQESRANEITPVWSQSAKIKLNDGEFLFIVRHYDKTTPGVTVEIGTADGSNRMITSDLRGLQKFLFELNRVAFLPV